VTRQPGEPASEAPGVDFSALYDDHPEYVGRRAIGSLEQAQIDIEVRLFKLPELMKLLPDPPRLRSVLEIGCATGELIASVPVEASGRKIGIDISVANVAAAAARHPAVEFVCGDFRELARERHDAVIMSDVLEHVPDDVSFLRDAAQLGRVVLVNLPLENNWLNRNRAYGPDDVSGHLRKYSLAQGLALFEQAGLEVTAHAQVWIHETLAEPARRELRRRRQGHAYSGVWPVRIAKQSLVALSVAVPTLGRRVFASNLFAAARARRP